MVPILSMSYQSLGSQPTSLKSILILSSHLGLGLPKGLLLSGFPTKTLYAFLDCSIHATCPAHLSRLDLRFLIMLGKEYNACSSALCNFLYTVYIIIIIMCSAQGQVLHHKLRHQGCNSDQRQAFHCKLRNLGCSFTRDGRCCSFLHPTLPLASEQTLKIWKDPRGTNEEVRRVDLANWALRTAPKFTTGVKYQFHQDFSPDHRSGNPIHPSLPTNNI